MKFAKKDKFLRVVFGAKNILPTITVFGFVINLIRPQFVKFAKKDKFLRVLFGAKNIRELNVSLPFCVFEFYFHEGA